MSYHSNQFYQISVLVWVLLSSTEICNAFLSSKIPVRNRARLVSFQKTTQGDLGRLAASTNPNDRETPEERKKRMELVRQLQKAFYSDETGIKAGGEPGILEDVPLWRVQWTELPGYQNVLNCHVPHYTHMFMKVVSGPRPWYFGHLYLPDGSENLNNPKYRLEKGTDATFIGTLMQVSDYQQLEDGRLLIVVQALERFRVLEATKHTPYAVATIELLPDIELVEEYYYEAKDLVLMENDDDDKIWDTARAAAIAEAMHWQPFEFRNVSVKDCTEGRVTPLANFDQGGIPEMPLFDPSPSMESYLQYLSDFGTIRSTSSQPSSLKESDTSVFDLEYDVWVTLDYMIRLLVKVTQNQSVQIPIPTQILGLIPSGCTKWPEGFMLDKHAARLKKENMLVGTASKSPFLQVHSAVVSYPPLRRAQRLSFVIGLLLDSIIVDEVKVQSKQSILELESIAERLKSAKARLHAITILLQRATGER